MSHFSSPSRRLLATLLLCGFGLGAAAQAPADSSEPSFPSLDSSYLKTGDFVSAESVKRVRARLNKDQVRLALGNPHFSEGLFAVREWDYALNFYTGKRNEFVTCQFKVKFDADDKAVSTHWKDPACAAYLEAPVVAPTAAAPSSAAVVSVVPVAGVTARRVTLGADGLFAFGRSGLSDLNPAGRARLDALAGEVKDVRLASVVVTGYTDRIGSSASNQTLSQSRADTVRTYLAQQGVSGVAIKAYGAGESNPVVQCPGERVTPALVDCLKANRRIVVELSGDR